MTHLAGIAGPTRFTDLRHVRKTVAFDGTAGNGAVGTVDIFTITGRVLAFYCPVFCTETLVEGAGANSTIELGTASDTDGIKAQHTNPSAIAANDWWTTGAAEAVGLAGSVGAALDDDAPVALSEDIILTIGTESIDDGTLVIDIWYMPATDDGALAAA